MATLSETVAVTVVLPETVAALAGALMDPVGLVVSMTRALLAARLVVGTKFVMALPAASLMVPETELTVKSAEVSPAWTV